MNNAAKKALEESIAKWQVYVDILKNNVGEPFGSTIDRINLGIVLGAINCPLCMHYYHDACDNCPVAKHIGKGLCGGTPYEKICLYIKDNFLTLSVVNDTTITLFRDELNFLISLKGEE